MGKSKKTLVPAVMVAILLGLVLIFLMAKFLWKIWNENAFEILTELMLPAGKLYHLK